MQRPDGILRHSLRKHTLRKMKRGRQIVLIFWPRKWRKSENYSRNRLPRDLDCPCWELLLGVQSKMKVLLKNVRTIRQQINDQTLWGWVEKRTRCWRCRERGTHTRCWWECSGVQALEISMEVPEHRTNTWPSYSVPEYISRDPVSTLQGYLNIHAYCYYHMCCTYTQWILIQL